MSRTRPRFCLRTRGLLKPRISLRFVTVTRAARGAGRPFCVSETQRGTGAGRQASQGSGSDRTRHALLQTPHPRAGGALPGPGAAPPPPPNLQVSGLLSDLY